jgi:hypothetical protein
MYNINNTRTPGVLKAVSQDSPERVELQEGTVVQALPAELMFVEFVEKARLVRGLAICTADGSVYLDPNGSAFAAALRPANDRFKATLSEVLKQNFQNSADLPEPAADVVDVVAAQMVEP